MKQTVYIKSPNGDFGFEAMDLNGQWIVLQEKQGYFYTEQEMEILKRIAKKDKEEGTNIIQEILLETEYGVAFLKNLQKLQNEQG